MFECDGLLKFPPSASINYTGYCALAHFRAYNDAVLWCCGCCCGVLRRNQMYWISTRKHGRPILIPEFVCNTTRPAVKVSINWCAHTHAHREATHTHTPQTDIRLGKFPEHANFTAHDGELLILYTQWLQEFVHPRVEMELVLFRSFWPLAFHMIRMLG